MLTSSTELGVLIIPVDAVRGAVAEVLDRDAVPVDGTLEGFIWVAVFWKQEIILITTPGVAHIIHCNFVVSFRSLIAVNH